MIRGQEPGGLFQPLGRFPIATRRRESPPKIGLGTVPRDAKTPEIHEPELILSPGDALIRGLAVPLHRLGVVLGNAETFEIHEPEIVLGHGVALLGQRLELL